MRRVRDEQVHGSNLSRTTRSAFQTGACTPMRSLKAALALLGLRTETPASPSRRRERANLARRCFAQKGGRAGGPLSRSPASRSQDGMRANPVVPGPRRPHRPPPSSLPRRNPALASGRSAMPVDQAAMRRAAIICSTNGAKPAGPEARSFMWTLTVSLTSSAARAIASRSDISIPAPTTIISIG